MGRRGRGFYLFVNLVMPGLGQLGLKWYLRGILEIVVTCAAFIWAVYALFSPLLSAAFIDLTTDQMPSPDFRTLGIALAVIFLVWAWSMLEIIIFYDCKNDSSGTREKQLRRDFDFKHEDKV